MKTKKETKLIAFQRIINGLKYVIYAVDSAEADTLFNKLIQTLQE